MPCVDSLDRFQIEAVYAFGFAGMSLANAADLLHISKSTLYNDIVIIRKKTGLDPYKPEQLGKLLSEIEKERKEKMGGREIDIGSYLCGK